MGSVFENFTIGKTEAFPSAVQREVITIQHEQHGRVGLPDSCFSGRVPRRIKFPCPQCPVDTAKGIQYPLKCGWTIELHCRSLYK